MGCCMAKFGQSSFSLPRKHCLTECGLCSFSSQVRWLEVRLPYTWNGDMAWPQRQLEREGNRGYVDCHVGLQRVPVQQSGSEPYCSNRTKTVLPWISIRCSLTGILRITQHVSGTTTGMTRSWAWWKKCHMCMQLFVRRGLRLFCPTVYSSVTHWQVWGPCIQPRKCGFADEAKDLTWRGG